MQYLYKEPEGYTSSKIEQENEKAPTQNFFVTCCVIYICETTVAILKKAFARGLAIKIGLSLAL